MQKIKMPIMLTFRPGIWGYLCEYYKHTASLDNCCKYEGKIKEMEESHGKLKT